jgi:hypothetical protein
LKIEPAARHECPESRCSARCQIALAFASSVYTGLWRVESDKADCLPADANRVGVDDLHRAGRDRLGSSWRRQDGEYKSQGDDCSRDHVIMRQSRSTVAI